MIPRCNATGKSFIRTSAIVNLRFTLSPGLSPGARMRYSDPVCRTCRHTGKA